MKPLTTAHIKNPMLDDKKIAGLISDEEEGEDSGAMGMDPNTVG